MNILLDTHVILFLVNGNTDDIPQSIVDMIEDVNNQVYYSMVSFIEVAIKISYNKLTGDINAIVNSLQENNILELNLKPNHLAFNSKLPFVSNHSDPFDRLLVSQSIVEKYFFCTHDQAIKKFYNKLNLQLIPF